MLEPVTIEHDTAPVRASTRASREWSPVIALATGIALLVASEFLPASVLPAMAADLGVSEGTAGLAVAATAIAGAVTAPSIAVLLPRTDRRLVLVALLAAGALANLAVAIAPHFALLLAGRLVLGVAIAGYWSFAFGVGTHAVPGRNRLVSTALAFGVSVATVVALPIASLVSDVLGWRAAFVGAAVLGALSAAAVAATVPPVPAHPAAGLAMLRRAIRNRRLVAGVACIVLVAFGNFAAYPYIRLAIERVDPGSTAWLLLAWGIGGMAGTVAAGALARWLRPAAALAPVLIAVGLLLTATATALPPLAVGVVLWGFGFNMVPVATQLWVTRVEPERAESAMSLQVTAFQVAITLGASMGGVIVDARGVGPALVVGASVAAVAALGFGLLRVPRE
ncbi:DHA1 family purine ribonucleoside efflux pump-like MFS transporter [Pseudonocardia kunmingensis]|uniref:DHA1 family purine ribonucleoside efflux pump-like MFS transporter n=1 Tax=Pseudonocardia kunmingensis TaxID=630975 RepID=A0A543DIJ9_9PSEU|nr:DHA1 family purine ribonucleoside efflux pump-like MFS transporter [Pseudonocardia kunmingensis]